MCCALPAIQVYHIASDHNFFIMQISCLPYEHYIDRPLQRYPILYAPHIVCKWTCTRACKRMVMRTEAKGLPLGLRHRRCGCWGLLCSTVLGACCGGVLSRWRLSVTICADMFYDTFVFNFGFYPLWWCIYYHWCLYFLSEWIYGHVQSLFYLWVCLLLCTWSEMT